MSVHSRSAAAAAASAAVIPTAGSSGSFAAGALNQGLVVGRRRISELDDCQPCLCPSKTL